jgi:hypothetical protein
MPRGWEVHCVVPKHIVIIPVESYCPVGHY